MLLRSLHGTERRDARRTGGGMAEAEAVEDPPTAAGPGRGAAGGTAWQK